MHSADRHIYWLNETGPGCEQLELRTGTTGVHALGMILLSRDDRHFRCRYEIEVDSDWQFKRLAIAVAGTHLAVPRRLDLLRDSDGAWTANGEIAEDLAGCHEIDLQATPFTNSLPIRRLRLAKGDILELQVAYVSVPELEPRAVAQRYSCLEPISGSADAEVGSEGGRYLYEGLTSDFKAELPVDRDGIVIDYPEIFRRQWPR